MRSFQSSEAEEVERTARDIYEQLEKNPVVLYSLRGGKFALDVAAVAGSVAAGGIGWQDFIIAPLVASLTHQLVELLGWQVVDAQREQTRHRQQELLKQQLSGPMAEWLTAGRPPGVPRSSVCNRRWAASQRRYNNSTPACGP